MKNLLAGCFLILAIGLALLHWSEKRESSAREQRMVAVLEELKREREETVRLQPDPIQTPGPLQSIPAPAPVATPPKALRRLMQDPEMRENLRLEAVSHGERLAQSFMSQGLTNLFQMNPEQKQYMHALLTNKFAVHWKFLDGAMAGEIRPDNIKEEAAKVKREMQNADNQIKGFLGDDNFKTFKDFERVQPDRERINEMVRRLTTDGVSITTEQSDKLSQIFSDERKAYPWRVNFEENNGFDFEHFFVNTSEARADVYFQDMEQLQARILSRAQSLLQPDQLAAFAEEQRRELSRSKFVFKSTTALMNASR